MKQLMIMEFLIDHHLFQNLSEETMSLLHQEAKIKKLESGTVLTKEGEKNQGFYLLRHGLVKITRKNKDQKDLILWLAGTGDCPGIDSFFHGDIYKTTSITMKDSLAYFFSKTKFDEILKKHPHIALEMMKYIAKKINDLESRIFNMNKKRKRMYFIEILHSLNSKRGNKAIIPDLISINEMANLLGTDKRYVYTLIKFLEAEKLVSFGEGKLEITNSTALKNHLIPFA